MIDRYDVTVFMGVLLVLAGVWLWAPPAALLCAGLALMYVGLTQARIAALRASRSTTAADRPQGG